MLQELITINSGKINEYLHHIDLKAYGKPRMLSVYLAEFDNYNILFDCGTSLNITNLIKYFKENQISLKSFKYLIPSHHHVDHNGGLHRLYNILKKYNPNVKILSNMKTKKLLNNYEHHFNRAKRTYGDFVGYMAPIEENAFKVIQPNKIFSNDLDNLEIIDIFTLNGEEFKLSILKTPGHVPDHQSPLFIKDDQIDFIFFGEAVGTIYHSSELVTMPVSMPIYYNHEKYMKTLENLKNLAPEKAGFCHFGIVNGEKNVKKILLEHESFMKKFKNLIIEFYEKKPETKYVVDKIMPYLIERTDLDIKHSSVLKGIVLGIVYGMMISLGYRTIPEEELKFLKLYA